MNVKLIVGLVAGGVLVLALVAVNVADSLRPKEEPESPFKVPEPPALVLGLGIDTSLSCRKSLAEDGDAWRMCLAINAKYFRSNPKGRVVISHLSAKSDFLFSGTPLQLREKFPDPDGDDFRKALLATDPYGSSIHRGATELIDFLLAQSAPRMVLILLSDMDDTDTPKDREKFLEALGRFGAKGGVVGMYGVGTREARDLAPFWRATLKAKVKHSVVTEWFESDQPLPSFE